MGLALTHIVIRSQDTSRIVVKKVLQKRLQPRLEPLHAVKDLLQKDLVRVGFGGVAVPESVEDVGVEGLSYGVEAVVEILAGGHEVGGLHGAGGGVGRGGGGLSRGGLELGSESWNCQGA